jgi:hypothetical protein
MTSFLKINIPKFNFCLVEFGGVLNSTPFGDLLYSNQLLNLLIKLKNFLNYDVISRPTRFSVLNEFLYFRPDLTGRANIAENALSPNN